MTKRSIISTIAAAAFIFFLSGNTALSQKVTITTSPQSAKIYVNGVPMGSGKLVVTVPSKECVTVEVRDDGYLTEERTYCKKRGVTAPPKSDYFQLDTDESYTSSIQSDIANKEGIYAVKKERTRDEAWKIIVTTVLSNFDVLESNDEKSGYLRTNWLGQSFKRNTVRMRLIIKLNSEDPLTYKIKFVSEYSGRNGTPFSADEQYGPFSRILKKYDGFLEELATKLKN